MIPKTPTGIPDILASLGELKKAAVGASREVMEMAKRHPKTCKQLIETTSALFQRWFSSPTYRKFWDFFQLWKYRDEQHYFEVDEFGLDPAMLELMEPFFQFLYYQYFRVEVENAKNIHIEGPAILIANHSGGIAYDGAITNLAVMNNHPDRRYARYLVDDFVYYLPFVGTFIQRTGGIRVLVFPEGIKGVSKLYDQRYQLQRFGRGGYVRLAMRTGVPVIPTAIVGAEEIHPLIWKSERLGKMFGLPYFPFTLTFPWLGPLGAIPLPTKWRIIFGKPMKFGRYKPKDADNVELVNEVSNRIRSQIQVMIDDELRKRESVWY
jgi:1-acyl-sn-glycerol-3-phosphate acyltransferase